MQQEPDIQISGSRTPAFTVSVRALALTCLLLSSAACSSNTASSPGSTTSAPSASGTPAALCDDLQALTGNVDQLRSLDPNTTSAAEVQSLIAEVKSNLNKASQDASGLAAAKIAAINATYTALVAALSALPTSITGSQAFQRVQPQITALIAALDAAKAGTSCPSASTSS